MSKHTPGPWLAVMQFGEWSVRQDPKDWDGRGYQFICGLPAKKKGSHYGDMFAANARLIAAAPDLLEALEQILKADDNQSRQWAREAIAKATGAAAMSERQCIVCNRKVPQGYEQDHLRANHLGPHTFWFNAVKFTTMEPSMTVAEIKKLADTNSGYQFFIEQADGNDIGIGDGQSVDLTQQPHFYACPPATMFG